MTTDVVPVALGARSYEVRIGPGLIADVGAQVSPLLKRRKVAVVTGASSGIGLDCAHKLADAGAIVVLAARTPEKLGDALAEIRERGGTGFAYPCDLAEMADCDRFVQTVLREHGHVDILINNAGRSIRRSVQYSFDRFHDFERTMQLNYFGALRLILGFAPRMLERRNGKRLFGDAPPATPKR